MDLLDDHSSPSPSSTSTNNCVDLSELVTQLQQEKLLVTAEKNVIQSFNEQLAATTIEFLKTAWINFQQRINLNSLVGARADCSAVQCTKRAHLLTNSVFIDAKNVLEYQVMVNYSAFLSCLRTRPELVAQWVVIGESLIEDQKAFSSILHSLVTGLYGALLLPQDVKLMMTLLQCLAKLQLVTTDNPRRLLKQRLCAFSRMYFLFHEGLTSAKLFLIAALQTPILKLIAISDTYLDIDPNKTLSRFTAAERQEKFGEDGTDSYNAKVAQYRAWINRRLCEITKLFITNLQDNVYCFPSSLAWLIRQIAHMISKSFSPHSKEINAITTDLILTLFVCPAIVQPEPYGISDAPISEVARHNLIQVATIIQMLALMKFETPDAKLLDLYKMFDTEVIANFLDIILNNSDHYDIVSERIPVDHVAGVTRKVALFTELELYELVVFLKRAQNSISQDQQGNDEASSDYCSNNADNAAAQPNDPVVILVNKLPTSNESSPRNTMNHTSPTMNNNVSPKRAQQLLSKARAHLLKQGNGEVDLDPNGNNVVLVIPLDVEEESIGLLPEEKVVSMESIVEETLLIDVSDSTEQMPTPQSVNGPTEKRTRFSHNDEGSIGNTSDNLEVISEAASNHSVASSIELENEDQNDNDNLSDMVSANVSGRGTPNISGRDTPSSQVTENEDQRPLVEVRPFLVQPQPQLKQIRSEIDDKFCKFEIKKLLEGDETISIISDTWSTDVLASDSETIDASERHDAAIAALPQQLQSEQPNLDVAETHSESAWSTDVLASDTERLTEVDNDDVASVAPSDDTASVARSDDAASVAPSERSEIDEHLLDRRLSTASGNNFVPNSPGAFHEYEGRRESSGFQKAEDGFFRGSTAEVPEREQRSLVHEAVMRQVSRSTDGSKREAVIFDKSVDKRTILHDISNIIDGVTSTPGPSGLKSAPPEAPPAYVLVKNVEHKFEDAKADMQLSNTSLNSSSSGSSNSSELKSEKWKNKAWAANNCDAADALSTATGSAGNSVSGGGDVVKKNRGKPSPSTGAIPKSISFDMSAEKGDKDLDDEHRGKRAGSFFGKLRMNFRHRRGKSLRGGGVGDDYNNGLRFEEDDVRGGRRHSECVNMKALQDVTEDILAKYRTSKPTDNSALRDTKCDKSNDMVPIMCQNVDGNSIFMDAKKKLRWVLSNSRTHYFRYKKDGRRHIKKDLESFLQIELAKARDLRQLASAARVAEALRCVRLLDIAGFNKLCENLRDEMKRRTVYWKYLFRSKQTLLSSQSFLNELGDQVQRERELCTTFLIEICVRNFLDKHAEELAQFCGDFKQRMLIDEKNHLLEAFLRHLYALIERDALWQDATDTQLQVTRDALERALMMEVYGSALHPNGDGDRHRDTLLGSHLRRLAATITPGNKYLMISKVHQMECPWLPAQEALQAMAAYRTPRDKVRCVTRAAFAIMDLLSLAQGSSASADDLIPVLVYVIIQVNPQDLLSTIQYVNSFYSNLAGEDFFYWTQFCSAVEFTKTMEYAD